MRTDTDPTVSTARVRERLARVTDPELDRSIVDLDYVDEIAVTDDRVTVRFTLPTAWCSPAFAWMMAVDARDEVAALPEVSTVRIELRDHMHETEITEGVNARQSFDDAFPDADGGVAEVRATLDDKARLARQYEAVEALLDAGLEPAQVVGLTPDDVRLPDGDRPNEGDPGGGQAVVSLRGGDVRVPVPAEPLDRYLRKARETGHVTAGEPLIRTPAGDPVDAESFDLVHRRTRLARVNMTGQGGVCDALNDARRAKLNRD